MTNKELKWEWQCLERECRPAPARPLRYRYASAEEAHMEYVRHKIEKHGLHVVPDWEQRIRAEHADDEG